MDTSKLKSFAPAVRKKLHEAIGRKLDFVLAAQTPDLRTTFEKQVASLREKSQKNRKALIEEAAYTWFNRLTALRYLDAQGWHPFNAKILMPAAPGEAQPEILKMVNAGSMPEELKGPANHRRIMDLLNRNIPSQNPEQEAYRQLVLGACRFYHATLPSIFAKLDDETELLLPDDLLGDLSIAAGFRTEIQDADCEDVEVIGWLYQFYISEEKATVMARKSAVPTEDIPAVTQLFTPHWIVRYLVENSLGRLWLLNRPTSGLKAHMPYYIEGDAETEFPKITKPEEIKLVDPAVGSGHMLTYAFDLLYLIYEEEGYPASDIPGLILKHNLHGIEICPRAAQLAELALAFKARKKARRFFQPGVFVRPQITELQEIRFNGDELRDYIKELKLGALFDQGVIKLLHQFECSKNFGSLIIPCITESSIVEIQKVIKEKDLGGQLFLRETHANVVRVLNQALALSQRYHVIVANPPYMGLKGMNSSIKDFADIEYAEAKSDLYAMFIKRGLLLAVKGGFSAQITMHSWMFLPSYEELRPYLRSKARLVTMAHLGPRAFDSISGEVVQTAAFVYSNGAREGHRSVYHRLVEGKNEEAKSRMLLNNEGRHTRTMESMNMIPGRPIIYWMSDELIGAFSAGVPLDNIAKPRTGMATADNDRFLRYWSEVSNGKTDFSCLSISQASASGRKWFPYNKGGKFRKWYGNCDFVVNWENDGKEIRNFTDPKGKIRSAIRNPDFYFKEGITWTTTSSSSIAARKTAAGFLFDVKGSSLFPEQVLLAPVLGFIVSPVANSILSMVNPTTEFQVGNLASLPLLEKKFQELSPKVTVLIEEAISLSKQDWDSFETSWDFCLHPLVEPSLKTQTLENTWENWNLRCISAVQRMKKLEEGNNRLFVEAYGLGLELQSDVDEDQITLARAEKTRDIESFISYAVGCMMGRYSLDKPGLILADAGDTLDQYLAKVGKSKEQLKFQPDDDGILPVMDVEWFEDDIVSRFEAFLVATFGADKLTENIQFIEKSLGTDVRSYFLGGFYKDHHQTYKKRPIYWMAQSPKKAFCALIYLHRYTKDTLSLLLNSYLRPYIVKLNSRIEILAQTEVSAGTAREKTAARKELEKLRKYVRECQEWERDVLLPAAQSRIDLDLDDGVKVNYLKLGDVLTPIPGLATKDEE
jgi:type II restriction/modification system DNA methylase subunit YeeA